MNTNFLNASNFQVDIVRLPNVQFFVKSLSLPGVSSTPVEIGNPFSTIPLPGDHMSFDTFSMQFFIDEEMKSYKEIFYWMKMIYFPRKFDQYKEMSSLTLPYNKTDSDITLSVLSSNKKLINTITMINAFPISLSSVDFTYENEDTVNPIASVTFAIQDYDIK